MSEDKRDNELVEREEDIQAMALEELDELEKEIIWSEEDVAMMALASDLATSGGLDAPGPEEYDRVELSKQARYLEALKVVLSSREGQIVLTHFINEAKAFDRICSKGAEIYANAALNDYAQDRLMEIAMAGPKLFNEYLYQGMRNHAFEHKIRKLLKKGR